MLVPGVSTATGAPAASDAATQAARLRLDRDDARAGGGAVARRGGGERADARRDEQQVEVLRQLGEQRRVAVDDPMRRPGVADVGDLQHPGRSPSAAARATASS